MNCRQLVEMDSAADIADRNNPAFTGRLKVVCQHCGKRFKDKPCEPAQDGHVSHGICPECHMREMEKIRLQLNQMYGRDHQPRQPSA